MLNALTGTQLDFVGGCRNMKLILGRKINLCPLVVPSDAFSRGGNNNTQETAQRHFYVGGTPTALPSRCSLEALLPWNVKVEDRRRGKLVNVLRAEKITNGVDIRALTAYSAA